MIQAVVLDFDDTLCMTEESSFNLENDVLARMGRPPMSRDVHRSTWGMFLLDAIALRSPGVDVDAFWELFPSVHEEHIRDKSMDMILDVNLSALDEMIKMGKQIYIVTSRTMKEMTHILDPAHHIAGRVSHIYHKDNTPFLKPDPRVFEPLLTTYDLDPANCVYVGDSPSDGVAANAAGIPFVASLESGVRTKEDFAHVICDATIDYFVDLPAVITSLDTQTK